MVDGFAEGVVASCGSSLSVSKKRVFVFIFYLVHAEVKFCKCISLINSLNSL